MPFWISGDATTCASAHGFAWTNGAQWEVLPLSREGLRRDEDPPPLVAFAPLDPRGHRAIFRQRGRALSLVERGRGVRPCDSGDADVVALARASGDTLVAAVKAGDDVTLARATVDGDALRVGDRIVLGDPVRMSPVPPFFKVRDRSPWIEERDDDEGLALDVLSRRRGGHFRGSVCLASSPYGVVVTSTYNGVCAVLDPRTLKARFLVRVPSEQEQFELFVCPLPRGALVTAVANYRHTMFMLVDDDGRAISWSEKGTGVRTSGVLLASNTVLVEVDEEPHTLELPSLESKPYRKLTGGIIDHGSNDDGSRHVIALVSGGYYSPHHWRLHRIDGSSTARVTSMPTIDFRAALDSSVREAPTIARETGAPVIGVSADVSTAWRVRVGETATLHLTAVNTGGPVSGLWVEVAGPAVTGSHAAVVAAASGDRTSAGSSPLLLASAALDGAAIRNGKSETPPEPNPSRAVAVVVRGLKPGRALLTVRIGAIGTKGALPSGSGLCGRTLEVVE